MTKIRIDPSPRDKTIFTLYNIIVKDIDDQPAIIADSTQLNNTWQCVNCEVRQNNDDWTLATSGGLAIASPKLANIDVARITIEFKARPLNNTKFLSWLFQSDT